MELLKSIDDGILLFIQEHLRADFLTPFFKAITFLGEVGWFWILLGLVFLCFKQTRKAGLAALVAMFFGMIFTNLLLKNIVARPRPFDEISALIPLVAKPTDFSFPSGHTTASFASAFIYLKMLPKKYSIPTLILAALIAYSRLYLGVHYPTDILGGLIVALVCSLLSALVLKFIMDKESKNNVSA